MAIETLDDFRDPEKCQRLVIKIGSALLVDDAGQVRAEWLRTVVNEIVTAQERGQEVVVVSSGAIAIGAKQLGFTHGGRRTLAEAQASASVGQISLASTWSSLLTERRLVAAQLLLTLDDFEHRRRYLNISATLRRLLKSGVVPVVNENDTVVTDEIRFGDNDTLGALVTNLVEADLLVILTDQNGMFDADPRTNPSARLISHARASDPALVGVAGGSAGSLGRGGMATKLRAAQLAARSGAASIIVGGRLPAVLSRIQQAEAVGTLLTADESPMAARKQWLAGHLQMRGVLTLDAGAAKVLREKGVSLLPVGVRDVTGNFSRGEMVSCVGPDNQRVACGLVNYSAEEARRIMGKSSDAIASILGYVDEKELIHRDNMVVF